MAIQELISQRVIDAQFAAAVLMVDFANPVFSARRSSLMRYADMIQTATVLSPGGANANGIPVQFIALVSAAAQGQPACNPVLLSQCTPEQQFLFFAKATDWRSKAAAALADYGAVIEARITDPQGVNDYMTLAVSRQAQFRTAPVVSNLDEFTLLLPCNDIQLAACQRMNVDGTVSDDPDWPFQCPANACIPAN